MNIFKKFLFCRTPSVYMKLREILCYYRYYKRKNQRPEDYPKLLEKRYKELTGINMNIFNPTTYSEKIQWLKLYDPNPLRTDLTDKVKVREWIRNTIGQEYLVPIYGIYNNFEEIEFDRLPDKFVIKTNHASGWNIVVRNKKELDLNEVKKLLGKWLKLNYAFWSEYEIHYSPIKPQIIIEKYLENDDGCLTDYKFLCFSGKPRFVWVDFDRFNDHKRNVYDMKWSLQPWNQFTYANYLPQGGVPKPKNFDKMVEIATVLSKEFIHVRVDLYNIEGKIYFGEMTFTNGSGFERLYPIEYEKIIGNLIQLPDQTRYLK